MDRTEKVIGTAREALVANAWSNIDANIAALIRLKEDPFYILKVVLQVVRDKKEGEA